jgi:cytoskeletal protein CcmA (bactofilin family)
VWTKRDEKQPGRPYPEPILKDERNFPPSPPASRVSPPVEPPQRSVREAAPEPRRNAAVIGASMRIKGEIRSEEELFIDGEIEGSMELQQALTVGPNGKVRANIKAREVTVLGSVKGNVEVVEKIAIRENGSLIGDIKTAGISIDDGAYFKGSIDIVRSEPRKQPNIEPQVELDQERAGAPRS